MTAALHSNPYAIYSKTSEQTPSVQGSRSNLCAEDFESMPPLIRLPASSDQVPVRVEMQDISLPASATAKPQREAGRSLPYSPAVSSVDRVPVPRREEMKEPERRLVSTFHCGDGSESCENCSQITAGVGVGLLCGSLGLWAFHCPYEVPFAIAGGVGVGIGACYALAKDSACIPECGVEWR